MAQCGLVNIHWGRAGADRQYWVGERAVTADTALRHGRFLGTYGKNYLPLQAQDELTIAKERLESQSEKEVMSADTDCVTPFVSFTTGALFRYEAG